jgi:hypothetical protein
MIRPALKAIETRYNGYRFRSRLEARWAVFFDALGITYEYEKEGYDLGGIRYLPDFWLPEQKCWVEIKGPELTKEERRKGQWLFTPLEGKDGYEGLTEEMIKADMLAYASGGVVYICYGPISENPHILMFTGHLWDQCMLAGWYQCRQCKKFVIWPCYVGCACYDPYADWQDRIFPYENNSPRLMAAYTAARQARFEHGETPIPPIKGDDWKLIERERPSLSEVFPHDYEDIPEPMEDKGRIEALAFARDIVLHDALVTTYPIEHGEQA